MRFKKGLLLFCLSASMTSLLGCSKSTIEFKPNLGSPLDSITLHDKNNKEIVISSELDPFTAFDYLSISQSNIKNKYLKGSFSNDSFNDVKFEATKFYKVSGNTLIINENLTHIFASFDERTFGYASYHVSKYMTRSECLLNESTKIFYIDGDSCFGEYNTTNYAAMGKFGSSLLTYKDPRNKFTDYLNVYNICNSILFDNFETLSDFSSNYRNYQLQDLVNLSFSIFSNYIIFTIDSITPYDRGAMFQTDKNKLLEETCNRKTLVYFNTKNMEVEYIHDTNTGFSKYLREHNVLSYDIEIFNGIHYKDKDIRKIKETRNIFD